MMTRRVSSLVTAVPCRGSSSKFYVTFGDSAKTERTVQSAMKSILITGCNRGLGLGLVKHLAGSSKPPDNIFATCRDVNKATVRQIGTGDCWTRRLTWLDFPTRFAATLRNSRDPGYALTDWRHRDSLYSSSVGTNFTSYRA